MNHSVRKAATNGANRVIYHCHATNVIALTLHSAPDRPDFTRALWQSATECPVVFPEGVGVRPWMVPGGADIALATSELMKTYQAAIWAQHGLFASGPDFDITFGLAITPLRRAPKFTSRCLHGRRHHPADHHRRRPPCHCPRLWRDPEREVLN